VSYFLKGLVFVFLGSIISGFGFVGVVLLGKVTAQLSGGNTTTLIEVMFTLIYGAYLFILCWLAGKYIVPFYNSKTENFNKE
jgi:hypothetical protein